VDKTNRVKPKYYNDEEVGILFKFLKYDNGYIFKYINDSKNYLLYEFLEFNMDNCYIVGISGNIAKFEVGPKSEKYI